MKIVYVNLFYTPAWSTPDRVLAEAPLHRHLPREMAAAGHEVDVVLLFPTAHRLTADGVAYHFVPSSAPARSLGRLAGGLFGHAAPLYEPALRAARRVRALRPDLVHVHGTNLHLNLLLLRALLGRDGPPLVLHFHGGYPSARPGARLLQRFNLRGAARGLFTTYEHARPFVEAGLFEGPHRIAELMETSSPFRMRPRDEARCETGMTGRPVFLWTGRLHPLKDPLTALRGFERVLPAWPEAQLYLYYRTDELLSRLQAFVAARPPLVGHVHFRGTLPYVRMEAVYNSADVLLQASRREFSGCAVLDAMACGVLPAVTDLPSFRAMTDDGRHGVLFRPGQAEALSAGLLALDPRALPARAAEVRARFDEALSFPALARRLEGLYRELLAA